jgi:glycosyltransferase involved in cell wall biosynthesis
MSRKLRVAMVYGACAGFGGLGMQAATALAGLVDHRAEVHAFGPGHLEPIPHVGDSLAIRWHRSPEFVPDWKRLYTTWRWRHGAAQLAHDRSLGAWAAREIAQLAPDLCYVFTQVGLETLRWCARAGVPSILDNPNGHIRNFGAVYRRESMRWCGARYWGHPTEAMVARVEEEYRLAGRVRVSSTLAKSSMEAGGVPGTKISILPQPIDTARFSPPSMPRSTSGPIRLCFVGSLDLRKGFVYLLRAMRMLGREAASLEIVGATGNRTCRMLFAREREGLEVINAPGDPVPALRRAELFVFPTLEDGFGYAVAEAMASGLPAVVTDQCGAAELVRPGQTGWIIPAADVRSMIEVLTDHVIPRRSQLPSMGMQARADVIERHGPACLRETHDWFYSLRSNAGSCTDVERTTSSSSSRM